MSQEGVAIAQAVLGAFNSGDIDAAAGLLTEDVDLRPPSHLLDGVVFQGHDGFRAWVDRTAQSWRKAEGFAREVRAAGGRLVIAVDYGLIGHDSGVPVNQRYFSVWELREGKIAAVIAYSSEQEALEAVGLWDTSRPSVQ